MINPKFQTLLVFCILGLGFAMPVIAQTKTLKNIGFIQNNIWYSKDPFFNGDKVRIYTAVLNGSQYDFKGIAEFYIGRKLVGESEFSLVSGGFQVLWADWIAEEGKAKVFANIKNPRISLPGGAEELVVLENSKTGEIETLVDKDTDKDGVGNKIDTDDDNDKVPDIIEQKQGTNPLIKEKEKEATQSGFIRELEKSATVPKPAQIAESAKNFTASVNEFLDQKKEKAVAKKEEFQKRLGEGESVFEFEFMGKKKDDVEKDTPKENKDLLRLYILALSALIFSLEYKAIIYLFGIYVAYRVLKLFFKKLFFRQGVDN